MGRETTTTVRIDNAAAECRVLLEPNELICRGGHKRTFAHAQMKRLAAKGGELTFTYESHLVSIELDHPDSWLEAIKNPRTRAQKLGITPGMKVAILYKPATEDLTDIADILGLEPSKRLSANMDLVLCFTDEPDELVRLNKIKPQLADRGAVWLFWPKGRKDFAHEDIVVAAKAAGLVQTKSVGFSEIYSGLRLVRPAKKSR